MGIFNNLFSKKETNISNTLEITASAKTGYIGDAETIANVVATGLEKKNYSGMNEQLSTITQKNEEKDTYVFEHPEIVSRYYAVVILSCISLAFVYYLFIGIATACLSTTVELNSIGMIFIVVSIAVLFVNIVLMLEFFSTIRFKKRFDIYEELLGYKSLEFVEDLAICAKQKEELVIKDLKRATKCNLIPQGHFSRENFVFMISNDVYERYMEKPSVYDRYFQKILEEKHRIKSRSQRISEIMEMGEQYLEKINGYRSLIKGKNVSKKIARMEHIVSMIFHEIDVNPSLTESLGVFLNYYLPTTEKLMDTYVTLTEKQLSGNNVNQTQKEIEEAINTIVNAFERILEKLYEEQEMDISSDIAAMELSMKQEGLLIP